MNRKLIWVGIGVLWLIALAVAANFFFGGSASFRGASYAEPYPVAPQIELTRANGETFRLNDQKGKIVLLFFGYTSCPDVCPTTMAEMKQVVDELGAQAEAVQVVFVSVDPERDTSETMQEYAAHFNPSFIGLSGPTERLETIWADYGVFRESVPVENSAVGYVVNHTARIILIDPRGNMRLSYGFGTPVDDIVHDVRLLLK
ncbi:MAG: SCO family protein [Chloroflexota bacterium]